jgi:hypothetical protein
MMTMMPKIIPRKKWGAKHREGFGSRKLPAKTAHVHHSVTKSPGKHATLKQDIAAVRTLERIGQARFGGGISYSRVIMESGRVFSGLRPTRLGAHTKGHNSTGLGYVLVGNFSKKDPGDKQLEALEWAIARDMKKGFLAKGAKVYGHRDTSPTACPGNAAYKQLPRVRRAIAPKKAKKAMPILRPGSTGGAVKTLQKELNERGAKLVVDGQFGYYDKKKRKWMPGATGAAVVAWQKKKALRDHIAVGPVTWKSLGY